MKRDITELFCNVDEFAEGIEKEARKYQLFSGQKPYFPTRVPRASSS